MSGEEGKFSPRLTCPSCRNKAPMEIVCQYSQVQNYESPAHNMSWAEGPVFQLLLCPACHSVSFARIAYHDFLEDDGWETKILYPLPHDAPQGLPPKISKAYESALKVRSIDPNAFGVLLRRLLELICIDRNAKGRNLHEQLADLARRGEIPTQLAEMAHGLRQLGNIGAHAAAGELTSAEVPFLDKLCQAILEYVYYAPQLLREVNRRLEQLRIQKAD